MSVPHSTEPIVIGGLTPESYPDLPLCLNCEAASVVSGVLCPACTDDARERSRTVRMVVVFDTYGTYDQAVGSALRLVERDISHAVNLVDFNATAS